MRVQQQPAFILHHRPFRDTSQILDIISREHGKLSLVARGSRGPKSRLRGVLRPFMPLSMSWVQRTELGTLTGAELHGSPLRLTGDALLSGYYINELLLNFLHRHDPQPDIFDHYVHAIELLATAGDITPGLRRFEIELLRQLGYALSLEHEAESLDALRPDSWYEYRVEQGPMPVARTEGPLVFAGSILIAIAKQHFSDPAVLRAANRLLREVISFHLGGKELKSRRVLIELHRQRTPAS
ncbi:MAG: DNA repair protein RecO [Gammaproteobacteria bacterium]|nr:DNA repair protein RecO [Gammaproteobacteria bacterium]MDH5303257.1 DNA repair protein RecO [Gammaproteobacteria bacterium]MDH5322041.1 DNA repair protein RecO [Gammaproteobacteria bacterium]